MAKVGFQIDLALPMMNLDLSLGACRNFGVFLATVRSYCLLACQLEGLFVYFKLAVDLSNVAILRLAVFESFELVVHFLTESVCPDRVQKEANSCSIGC